MKSKVVSGIMLTLLLIGMFTLASNVQPVKAFGTVYIRADGSIDPPIANITTVDNITYTFIGNINDSIVVERDNIVIDGAGYALQGKGSGTGVGLSLGINVTIKNMEIRDFAYGISGASFYSTLSENIIVNNSERGICLAYHSHSNTISNNMIAYSFVGIELWPNSGGIPENPPSPTDTVIVGNTITNNSFGLAFIDSYQNLIFHNNFINNTNMHAGVTPDYANIWDYGYPSGGNFWSDYNGTDSHSGSYQNETGSDGIGDTPYLIDANETDNYPLLGMFSDFNVPSEYHVQTICNSSISDFQYNGTAICFNVTGETDTTGFCRICVPRALMNETYQVFVNGTEVPCNLLPCSNSTHSYLYFTYNHSTQEVMIVPEFPTWTSMLLILIVLSVAIAIYKRRLLKTPTH